MAIAKGICVAILAGLGANALPLIPSLESTITGAVQSTATAAIEMPMETALPSIAGDSYNAEAEPGTQPNAQVYAPMYAARPLRVAAGMLLDTSAIPGGDIFTGFDVRPGNNNGFQSDTAWTDGGASAAGQASNGNAPIIKNGMITSDSDIASALSVAVKGNGAFLGGAINLAASFGYDTTQDTKSHTVSAYTFGSMSTTGTMLANLNNLQLTPEAQQLITAGNPDEFFDAFGTHFIRTRVYGCQASTVFSYSCTTQKATQQIAASLSVSVTGAFGSGGASANTTYSTYAQSNLCTYTGTAQAVGVNLPSPDQQTMLNAPAMANYWSGFSQQCAQTAQSNRQLLYVELGNWLEVPAVQTILKANPAATGPLNAALTYMRGMQPQDLLSMSLGAVYEAQVQNAYSRASGISNMANPIAVTGFFDRVTGAPVSPSNPQQYWSQLPSAHAAVGASLAANAFSNYLNSTAYAMGNPIGFTVMASSYYNAVRALYQQAAAAYQFAYLSADAVFQGARLDGTEYSTQLSYPSNTSPAACNQVANGNYPPASQTPTYCGAQSGVTSECPVQYGLEIVNTQSGPMADVSLTILPRPGQPDSPTNTLFAQESSSSHLGYSLVPGTACCNITPDGSCSPLTVDLVFEWAMPSTNMQLSNANPALQWW